MKLPLSVQVVAYRLNLAGQREYLLLLRRRAGSPDFWQPVSGSLEAGEDFRTAALRELHEETGLRTAGPLVDLDLVNWFRIAPTWRDLYEPSVTHNLQTGFAVRVVADDVRLDPSEHAGYRWETYEEARRLMRYEPNKRALDLIERDQLGRIRREFSLHTSRRELDLGRRTLVMGVLNTTPDSFSDGGQFADVGRAVERALELEAEGADIIDIGGESSRPGASAVGVEEEIERVLPVIRQLCTRLRVPMSIDTTRARTARAAIDAGAEIVNDISGLRFDPELARVAADAGAALVLMHMRGTPATMQAMPPSDDIMRDVETGLLDAIDRAVEAGVAFERIILDPGIGFGKTVDQNVELIARQPALARLDRPLLVGTSRKSFLGALTGRATDERLNATVASVACAILRGAHVVRVHDVAAAADAVRVADSVLDALA